jgi:hypothetical protein
MATLKQSDFTIYSVGDGTYVVELKACGLTWRTVEDLCWSKADGIPQLMCEQIEGADIFGPMRAMRDSIEEAWTEANSYMSDFENNKSKSGEEIAE